MCTLTKTFLTSVSAAIALLLLCSAYVYAVESTEQPATEAGKKIYKKVGPNGEIIYTDKASPDSEEVKVLPPASNYKPVTPPTSFTPYQPPTNTPTSTPIDNTVTITAPKHEESIWSGAGEVTVSVSLSTGLAPGQQLEYLIDGTSVLSGTETSHTFSNIDRGSHVVTVQITDKSGKSITSPPVTFYMQRPSKNNKNIRH
jgi:hypothetical protein